MGKTVIKRANFDLELQKLKEFSDGLPKHSGFTPVDFKDSGWFWDSDHRVTGKEMNRFITEVQNEMVSFNEVFRDVIKEFNQVYQVLYTLDKEYVASICQNINKLNEVSQATKKISDDNVKNIERLWVTVKKLNQLAEDFKKFKEIDFVTLRKQWEEYVESICQNITELNEISQATKKMSDDNAKNIEHLLVTVTRLNQLTEDFKKFKEINFATLKRQWGDIGWLQNELRQLMNRHEEMDQILGILKMQNMELRNQIISMTEQQNNDRKNNSKLSLKINILAGFSLILSLVNLFLWITKV